MNTGRRSCDSPSWIVTRRVFLKASALLAAGAGLSQLSCAVKTAAKGKRATCRFGIVTDCHYADADARIGRYYRESLVKLDECVELMNAEKVGFLIELGDFKDEDAKPAEEKTISYLRVIEQVFQKFTGPTYHVLGNHDMDSISKTQFLSNVANTGIDPTKSYYSFDSKGFHFVVLDANYRSDGAEYDHGNFDWTDANIPQQQLTWLSEDLTRARGPVIVFVHQLLAEAGSHSIKNAEEVRSILESSGKVAAVFQGHKHDGGYSQIEGIHYYVLKAVVEGSGRENSAYAIVDILADGGIVVTGYRKAESRVMAPPLLSRPLADNPST
ncbi:MAG: metallophosphoesterase [Sedimentisphaerales bacterium]|nr:metallophosphoesterase [Sedimentisphaerales bacterium]